MSQESVVEFLKKHPKKWYTVKEISKYMKISKGSVATCCMKLRQYKEVQYKKGPNNMSHYHKYLSGKEKKPVFNGWLDYGELRRWR